MSDYVKTPWTDEQVSNLNDYQESGVMHPYTCDFCRGILVATTEGWVCVCGKHKQDWCLSCMAEFDKNSEGNQYLIKLNKMFNK